MNVDFYLYNNALYIFLFKYRRVNICSNNNHLSSIFSDQFEKYIILFIILFAYFIIKLILLDFYKKIVIYYTQYELLFILLWLNCTFIIHKYKDI